VCDGLPDGPQAMDPRSNLMGTITTSDGTQIFYKD
jgi:hypothetical protein